MLPKHPFFLVLLGGFLSFEPANIEFDRLKFNAFDAKFFWGGACRGWEFFPKLFLVVDLK